MTQDDLQTRVDELLARRAPDDEARTFTHFDFQEGIRASELAGELSATASKRGVEEAVDHAHRLAEREPLGVVKHALKLFITHDTSAARQLTLASPEASGTTPVAPDDADEGGPAAGDDAGGGPGPPGGGPRELAPERPGGGVLLEERAPAPVTPTPAPARDISHTTPAEEARLDWYREDPFANDHHHHWHIVYPGGGGPGPDGAQRTQPRQGELFFYMHQQMLARYDTERLIAGLARTVAFSRYDGELREGYALQGYGPRPAGSRTQDAQTVAELQAAHGEAEAAIAASQIELDAGTGAAQTAPLDANVLGCEVESSLWFRAAGDRRPARLRYANFHGNGHVLIAGLSEQVGFGGPMSYFETAIRDPAFYRWHRQVDDLYAEHQDRQEPAALGEFAADVAFRKQPASALSADIALCSAADIDGSDAPGFDFGAWGKEHLGVGLDKPGPRTDTLTTWFARSDITLPNVSRSVPIPDEWLHGVVHLVHDPFVTFLRIENGDARQDVTVRIFLAHAELAEERRMWIELDKFRATLEPGPNLVARADARSSVIKRKGLDAPGAQEQGPVGGETSTWCDCGWPYTMLLPSGESTAEGTPFRLAVVVTDWKRDHVGRPDSCGSMSFCGARGEYPDERAMGHPFHRRFPGGIEQAFAAEPSAAMRDLRIRCANQHPAST